MGHYSSCLTGAVSDSLTGKSEFLCVADAVITKVCRPRARARDAAWQALGPCRATVICAGLAQNDGGVGETPHWHQTLMLYE